MKHCLLILNCVLICLAGRSQSLYTFRYWFDSEQEEYMDMAAVNNNILEMELDVGSLAQGIHLLYIQVKDSTNNWCSPEHYMFYKTMMENPLNTEDLVYHCWFDQDVEHMQSGPFGTGQFLLDAAELEEGTHLLYVVLEGNGLTSAENYMFYKAAVEPPISSDDVVYRCWFDQDYNTLQSGLVGNGIFELDTDSLIGGIHTLYIQLDNGSLTAPQCYLFYKKLEKQRIARWEYWLNDNINQRHTSNLSPWVDSLSIISLLPMEACPIRSSCFHFHPNGDTPYINAKNEVTFRFWDTECHFIDKSALFVDEHISEPIVADSLLRDTTVCIPAPRDNQMQWYKVPLVVGDSIAFRTDKACTMQLFAPSGEEVYAATASEALVFGGIHAWEDGDYYLVVHDVTGSGDEICLTNVYVHKYAILAYDVHLVGNGGCSTITFNGNGFNSLLDAYLVNADNDTIQKFHIGHESNTTTTVTFDFYQVNLGVYDAVFQFYGETIRISGALEVQEPVDIVLTSSVSYPSQFLRNTPCTYTYTITNNGNMSAYGVPLFVYVSTATMDGISHLEFDGLKLPSIIDIMNLDSLSPSQIAEVREWVKELGDEDTFSVIQTIDDETGDTIIARCNFFFINLAPFETKTLKLAITANELLDVWMTVPNETVQPIVLEENRGLGLNRYCCVFELVECSMTVAATTLNLASLVADAIGLAALAFAQPEVTATLLTIGNYLTLASCYASIQQDRIVDIRKTVCADEDDIGTIIKMLSLANPSYFNPFYLSPISFGTILSCIPVASLGKGLKVVKEAIKYLEKAYVKQTADLFTDEGAWALSDYNCLKDFHKKMSNCPPGNHSGGESEPVASLDPNDIFGYLSESGSHYMRQEIQNVQYEIEFENDTTLATAAAHTIIVRDTLDATKFDLNSLAAHSVTIGDKRLELNGEQNFARTLDMRPELYVIAQIEQDYDPTTGIVEWTIQSLDPMTMEPTDNPYQGVLPVNYYGNGVGFIDYSINLKQAFADGTAISNRAGIIFDQNEVIMTPTWTNIIDAVKPTSNIEEVTPMADSLNFVFVSQDNRSGVWYHTLYYRNDSTDQQWQVRKTHIFENSFMLHLEDLQTTEYLVMAVDSAGNHEDKLFNAEYVFGLDSLEYYTLTLGSDGCGEVNGAGTYLAGSHVTIEAIPDEGCQFEQWNDGNTDNPRTIELVQDTTFVAQFSFDSMGTTQTIALSEGYNWWSTYIEQNDIDGLSMLQEGLGSNGITIRSQASGYTDYYGEDYGWWGSLASINNESSYRVVASTPCTVTLTGNSAVPSQHPITLSQGWTWIGYVPSTAMDINVALGGFEAMLGDKVKSQQGYSDYYGEEYGWFGSLNTIEPGMGLMYYSMNGSPVTFTYPDNGRGGEQKQNLTAEHNHWKPNVYAYPDNMTVMATIELDGEELNSEHYELAAFANGECRGSVRLTYAEPINRHVAFLTISGKDAAELSFRLYDMETGMEYYDAEESLDFVSNAIVGEADDLYTIHFRGTTGMDELASRVQVYPNPVNAGERFSINVADDVKTPVRVEIVNALGVETLRATSVQTPAQLTAPATAGVYTLRITVEGKGTVVRKLVVK